MRSEVRVLPSPPNTTKGCVKRMHIENWIICKYQNRNEIEVISKITKQVRTGKARDESHGINSGFNYDFNREKQKATMPVTVKLQAKFLKENVY